MARTDEPIKKLFKNKENFADLFNATIFQGEQIIKPDKLIEISTEDIHIKDISVQKKNVSSEISNDQERDETAERFRTTAECRRQILQKKADEKYIEENDEKLQHMNQDTHNAIVALM